MRDNALARNTMWMLIGQLLRLVVQAAYFILLARTLGARDYGAFVGVTAFVAIASPFASLGGGNLLIQRVATEPSSFGRALGDALSLLIASGAGLFGLILLLARFALPSTIPTSLILVIALAELLGVRLLELCGQAFQAFQRLGRSALLLVLLSVARTAAIILLIVSGHAPTPLVWGCWYLGATSAAALVAVALVFVELGWPIFGARGLLSLARQGIYFSIGLSAQTIYNDVDKTMLARLSTLEATGIYGSAYKIVDISFLPVSALLHASYPRFFHHGARGIAASLGYARRLFPIAAGAALASTIALLLGASLVPRILGADFAPSMVALRWLAPLSLVRVCHYLLAYALTGAGHQRTRSVAQVAVAIANVLVNLWLIPSWSWRGAAWTSLGSDVLLAASLYYCVRRIDRD